MRVNVVCPGPIDTPMLPGFIGRSDDKQQMAEKQKKLMAAVPLGRIGRPDEVAHAVLWLASDDASGRKPPGSVRRHPFDLLESLAA